MMPSSFCQRLFAPGAWVLATALCLAGPPAVGPEDVQTQTVSVNSERPLADAVRSLEERYGWIITYEDPPYADPGEMKDVTELVRRDGASWPRVLVPRGGPFAFAYAAPTVGAAGPDEAATLRGLLEAYASTGYPGGFRLVQTGTVFHIIPAMSKNLLGVTEARQSILDVKISLADEDRTVYGMLEAVTDAVSRATGVTLSLGTVPLNALGRLHVRAGASEESARIVLLRTLAATNQTFSWRLLRGPQPGGSNVLNVHFVRRALQQ